MSIEQKLDEALFKLIRSGDEKAMEMLFKSYYSKLCHYAITFVKTPEIAEEIVQETFITIWEKRKMIKIDVSWKAYIYRSVHNGCINFLKEGQTLNRQNKELTDEINSHQQIANLNLNDTILDKLISEELAKSIQETLEKIPVQCRTIFLMSREENLSYPEIAEKLNISINTVKTQMKRALKRLRIVVNKHLNS